LWLARSRPLETACNRLAALVLAVACLALAGCGSDDESEPAATSQETTTTETTATETDEVVGATSDQAAEEFGDWYRAAVREGGDKVPARLRADDPSGDEAIKGLIRILCAVDAPDTPRRHAAA
jgi:hypothetical protein